MKNKILVKKKAVNREIAQERIGVLFSLADSEALRGKFTLSDRYVQLARRIGMRYKVRIPKEFKGRFCKYCDCYLLPSKTSQVRTNPLHHRVEVLCLKCGRRMFFPYVRELKERRRTRKKDIGT